MSYWPLLGILLVVLGFALRMNPMLVVTGSAIVTGLLGGMDLVKVISTFGKAFNDNRIIAIVWIVLPVIGLLERYGLQQQAARVIRSIKAATVGRLLLLYLLVRQIDGGVRSHDDRGSRRRRCARSSRRWRWRQRRSSTARSTSQPPRR